MAAALHPHHSGAGAAPGGPLHAWAPEPSPAGRLLRWEALGVSPFGEGRWASVTIRSNSDIGLTTAILNAAAGPQHPPRKFSKYGILNLHAFPT